MSDAKHTDKHTKTQECVPKRTETHGDLISRKAAIDAMGERPIVWVGFDYEIGQRNQYDMDKLAIETVPPAQPDTTQLAQEIWTKVCLITDTEDANIQHEVIHYGDLKKVFLEVLGWEI